MQTCCLASGISVHKATTTQPLQFALSLTNIFVQIKKPLALHLRDAILSECTKPKRGPLSPPPPTIPFYPPETQGLPDLGLDMSGNSRSFGFSKKENNLLPKMYFWLTIFIEVDADFVAWDGAVSSQTLVARLDFELLGDLLQRDGANLAELLRRALLNLSTRINQERMRRDYIVNQNIYALFSRQTGMLIFLYPLLLFALKSD